MFGRGQITYFSVLTLLCDPSLERILSPDENIFSEKYSENGLFYFMISFREMAHHVSIRAKKVTRRVYYHWARLITQYPVRIICTSILLTLLSAVSFLVKTPFTIGTVSTKTDDFAQNAPMSYVLQFAMFMGLKTKIWQKKINFWQSFLFFDEIFYFWQNFLFLTKFLIFLSKNLIFDKKLWFLTKILILDKNYDFWRKFWFLTNILIFDKNLHLWWKFLFLTKTFGLCRKFLFLTKMLLYVEDFYFWQIFEKKFKHFVEPVCQTSANSIGPPIASIYDVVSNIETFEHSENKLKTFCFIPPGPILSGLSPGDARRLPRDDCLLISPASMFGNLETISE